MIGDLLSALWQNFPIGLIVVRLVIVPLTFMLHEVAHALAGTLLGDPTAREDGRLTLNPVPHQEPFGWLAGVLVGVGWSRPVPLRPHRMWLPGIIGGTLAVLAGPLANLAVVLGGQTVFAATDLTPVGVWHDLPGAAGWLTVAIRFNLIVALINALPLFPLDGWQLIRVWLPPRAEGWWQRGSFWTTTVLGVGMGALMMLPAALLGQWLGPPVRQGIGLLLGW